MEKALESLKQLPQGHKKQQFDFLGETRIILGDKRNTEQMTPPEKLKFFFTFNLKFKT